MASTNLQGGRRQETSMNHSIYSADRTTHLKIVVVALVAGVVVAGFSISARNTSDEGLTQTASTRVMKAGKPVVITSSGTLSYDKGEFKEFMRLFTAPKVATWIIKTPTTPKFATKTAAPQRPFLIVGASQ